MIPNKQIITGGILIVMILATVYFLIFKQSETERMYSKHFEPYPNIETSENRSEGNEDSELREVMSAYENGEYEKALKEFTRFLKNNPKKDKIHFYRGISHLQLGNEDKAINDFEQVALGANRLSVQATWYLGLTYLRKGQQDKADLYFRSLIKDSTRYAMDAKDILKNLGEAIAVGNERLYEITDEGQYQFTYWQDKDPVPHPITERTFFLEARDLDVLSDDISYREFKRLDTDEQQSLIVNGQEDIISKMDKSIDNKDLQKAEEKAERVIAEMRKKEETESLTKAPSQTLASKSKEETPEKTKKGNKEDRGSKPSRSEAQNPDMHWIAKNLTSPGTKIVLPTKTGTGHPINNTSSEQNTSDDETKKQSDNLKENSADLKNNKKPDLNWLIKILSHSDQKIHLPLKTEKSGSGNQSS